MLSLWFWPFRGTGCRPLSLWIFRRASRPPRTPDKASGCAGGVWTERWTESLWASTRKSGRSCRRWVCTPGSGVLETWDWVFSWFLTPGYKHFVFQCHGLSIEGFVLPSSTTQEVTIQTVYYNRQNRSCVFVLIVSSSSWTPPPDDTRRDQVLRPRGDGPEPRPAAGVPAAAGGGHPGAHHAGRRGHPEHRLHHPRGEDRPPGQRHVLQGSGQQDVMTLSDTLLVFAISSRRVSLFPSSCRRTWGPRSTSWRGTRPPACAGCCTTAPPADASGAWPTSPRPWRRTCRTSCPVGRVRCSEGSWWSHSGDDEDKSKLKSGTFLTLE